MSAKQAVTSVVLRTESINWKKLSFLQSDDLKELAPEDRQRLKSSILKNSFADPFKVWDNSCTDGRIYSLDGRHRVLILQELEAEGYAVPEKLPATFIDCPSKDVAAALVLVYSSQYARTTQEGLYAYMEQHGLNLDELKGFLNIPDVNLESLGLPDYTGANQELSVDAFPDLLEMKFYFNREDFQRLNAQLEQIRELVRLNTKEEVLALLIETYEPKPSE